jgi:hypothetical protein
MVPSYLYHMGAFAKYEVFLEIAVATWAKCFTPHYDTEAIELEICTTWDYSVRSEIMKWGPSCVNDTVIIHPVKYSGEVGLQFAKDFLKRHKTPHMNMANYV